MRESSAKLGRPVAAGDALADPVRVPEPDEAVRLIEETPLREFRWDPRRKPGAPNAFEAVRAMLNDGRKEALHISQEALAVKVEAQLLALAHTLLEVVHSYDEARGALMLCATVRERQILALQFARYLDTRVRTKAAAAAFETSEATLNTAHTKLRKLLPQAVASVLGLTAIWQRRSTVVAVGVVATAALAVLYVSRTRAPDPPRPEPTQILAAGVPCEEGVRGCRDSGTSCETRGSGTATLWCSCFDDSGRGIWSAFGGCRPGETKRPQGSCSAGTRCETEGSSCLVRASAGHTGPALCRNGGWQEPVRRERAPGSRLSPCAVGSACNAVGGVCVTDDDELLTCDLTSQATTAPLPGGNDARATAPGRYRYPPSSPKWTAP